MYPLVTRWNIKIRLPAFDVPCVNPPGQSRIARVPMGLAPRERGSLDDFRARTSQETVYPSELP